ncbi:hypothetical protein ACTHQY_11745 [Rhodococcoides corynebacterioides]|uniref:hypothetical protein n=1 Tax=Rhodococcoides corynebacterioides TaxID=53972 RepID=UPI003F80FD0F
MTTTSEPVAVDRDPSARCVDSDLPDLTLDEALAYWSAIFDDQRRQYPQQSFPTDEEIRAQRRDEWSTDVDSAVPVGGDAAFARDLCGLTSLDGALYSGEPLRQIRGHAAILGRSACSLVLTDGLTAARETTDSRALDDEAGAEARYLLESAVTHVCPQLADLTTPADAIPRCAVLEPDPSAKPDELVFCN